MRSGFKLLIVILVLAVVVFMFAPVFVGLFGTIQGGHP